MPAHPCMVLARPARGGASQRSTGKQASDDFCKQRQTLASRLTRQVNDVPVSAPLRWHLGVGYSAPVSSEEVRHRWSLDQSQTTN
jgi:hypothetical protein